MSALLVTGPTGFVGRHVLAALAGDGYDVIAVCRRPQARVAPFARWQAMDLMDARAVEALFSTVRPSHLVHLAWCAGSAGYRTDPANSDWARASGALARSFYAHGGRRAVFAGTSAEYQAPGARSLYAQTKIEAAEAMSAHARAHGGRFAWGRIFLPYGPHDSPHRLVPSVIDALLAGRIARCSKGEQERDFVHVGDVASALTSLLRGEREGPVDVGTGAGSTIRHAAEEIARQLARPELLRFDGAQPVAGEPATLVARPDALIALGVRHRNLKIGFAETIAWHRARMVA